MKTTKTIVFLALACLALSALSSCQHYDDSYAHGSDYTPAPIYYGNKSYAWHNSSDHVREYRGIYY